MQKKLPLNPGEMLGMMGGGQLGRMFAIEAAYMGYHVTVLEPGELPPAAEVSLKHIAEPYLSESGLERLANGASAVSTEFENVPAQALDFLARSTFVAPPGSAVAIAQDRNEEKRFIEKEAHVPVAPHCRIATESDIETADSALFPAILKTARLGYDGKGQVLVLLKPLKGWTVFWKRDSNFLKKFLSLSHAPTTVKPRHFLSAKIATATVFSPSLLCPLA